MGDPVEIVSLEFYGLPGCGKSTISHVLAEKLRKQGFKVWEPTYEWDHRAKGAARKLGKTARGLRFVFSHWNIHKQIKRFVTKQKGDFSIRQAVNLFSKCDLYGNGKNYDFIVWDEGIMQSAVSLMVAGNPKASGDVSKEILKCIKTGGLEIKGIYFDFPIKIAAERMQGRKTNLSRAEKMDGDKKISFLENFKIGCDCLDGCARFSDYELSPGGYAELLYRMLKEEGLVE